MPYVIKFVGLVGSEVGTNLDGYYLKYYDPSPPHGLPGYATLDVASEPELAKKYETIEDARQEWIRVDTRKPVREDGQPNRPLTAYTIEILNVP